jgi:hypothetical protein
MVLRICGTMDVPLRQQNALLLAAGYAPVWGERDLSAPDLAMVDTALDYMLAQARALSRLRRRPAMEHAARQPRRGRDENAVHRSEAASFFVAGNQAKPSACRCSGQASGRAGA